MHPFQLQPESATPSGADVARCALGAQALRQSGELRVRVTGTSMLPALWPGDEIRIRAIRPQELRPGDIAVCLVAGTIRAHRVRELCSTHLVTQGDSLPAADPPVSFGDVLGRVEERFRAAGAPAAVRAPGRATAFLSRLLFRSRLLRVVAVRLRSVSDGCGVSQGQASSCEEAALPRRSTGFQPVGPNRQDGGATWALRPPFRHLRATRFRWAWCVLAAWLALIAWSSTLQAERVASRVFEFVSRALHVPHKLGFLSVPFAAQKFYHLLLFASFGLWLYRSRAVPGLDQSFNRLVLFCCVIGIVAEGMQHYTARDPNLADALLNIASVSLGLLAGKWQCRKSVSAL